MVVTASSVAGRTSAICKAVAPWRAGITNLAPLEAALAEGQRSGSHGGWGSWWRCGSLLACATCEALAVIPMQWEGSSPQSIRPACHTVQSLTSPVPPVCTLSACYRHTSSHCPMYYVRETMQDALQTPYSLQVWLCRSVMACCALLLLHCIHLHLCCELISSAIQPWVLPRTIMSPRQLPEF